MKFYFSNWKLFFFSIFKIILILKISMFFCRHPILITGENHIFALQIKKLKISNLFWFISWPESFTFYFVEVAKEWDKALEWGDLGDFNDIQSHVGPMVTVWAVQTIQRIAKTFGKTRHQDSQCWNLNTFVLKYKLSV